MWPTLRAAEVSLLLVCQSGVEIGRQLALASIRSTTGLPVAIGRHHQASMNRDKQTATHADGLLIAPCKAVVTGGFEKPAKVVFVGGPKHEVTSHLTGD